MLFLVVADMVVKPGFGDIAVLAAMVVILLGGAFLFLGGLVRRPPAALTP